MQMNGKLLFGILAIAVLFGIAAFAGVHTHVQTSATLLDDNSSGAQTQTDPPLDYDYWSITGGAQAQTDPPLDYDYW